MAQNPKFLPPFLRPKTVAVRAADLAPTGSDFDCLELRRCPLRSLLLPGLLGLLNRLQRIGLQEKRPGFPEPLKSAKRTCNVRPQYSPCQDVATTASATSSVTARTNIAALTGGISHISTLSSLAPLRGDCSAARRARLPPGPVVTVRFARCERPARRLRGLPSEHRRYYRGSRRAWETFPRARETLRALGRVVSGRFAQNRLLRSAPKSRLRPFCVKRVVVNSCMGLLLSRGSAQRIFCPSSSFFV